MEGRDGGKGWRGGVMDEGIEGRRKRWRVARWRDRWREGGRGGGMEERRAGRKDGEKEGRGMEG